MPKILAANGFVVYIYPYEMNERHHAAHVHIYRGSYGGASMVVGVPGLTVLANTMTTSDARKAMQVIKEHLGEIMEKVEELQ